jgi:hypothetical protein
MILFFDSQCSSCQTASVVTASNPDDCFKFTAASQSFHLSAPHLTPNNSRSKTTAHIPNTQISNFHLASILSPKLHVTLQPKMKKSPAIRLNKLAHSQFRLFIARADSARHFFVFSPEHNLLFVG